MRRSGSSSRLPPAWAGALALLAAAGVGPGLAAPASAPAASAPAARASANAGGPAWGALTTQQQTVLAPLKSDWASIDAAQKRKWLDIARRYPQLPPDEQARITERMTEWARMSVADRTRARLNFQEAKQLSPQERQARWEAYQALPESERRALQARGVPINDRAALPAGAASRHAASHAAAASAPPLKPVAPTIVQVRPGATTTPMTHKAAPPLPLQPGAPKIAVSPAQIDPATLLPQTGPQAAARAASTPAR